jgi:two-component system, NarL family, nitrate/nitrite response regulator NarL
MIGKIKHFGRPGPSGAGREHVRLGSEPCSSADAGRAAGRAGQLCWGSIVAGWLVRLVLADSHRLVVESLAAALSRRGFAVVAVADSAPEALARVAEHRPDVCLLAAEFPACSGLDVLRVISEQYPYVKAIMLMAVPDPGLIAAAIEDGAAGFISRDCHIVDMVRALSRVSHGGRVFDGDLLGAAVVRTFRRPGAGSGDRLRVLLTSREQEVLTQIADGECTRQIARSLDITEATVRTHVQNVLVKLGVHSRLEASTMVARSGVLSGHLLDRQAGRAAGGR